MKIVQGSSGTGERAHSIPILFLEIGDRIYNAAWIHQHFSRMRDFKTAGGEFIVEKIDTNGARLKCAKKYCEMTKGPIDHTRIWKHESPIPEFLNLTGVES